MRNTNLGPEGGRIICQGFKLNFILVRLEYEYCTNNDFTVATDTVLILFIVCRIIILVQNVVVYSGTHFKLIQP